MSQEKFSEEETKKLEEAKGQVRGMGMKAHADFIYEKEGPEGLERLERAMAEAGYPVQYKEIKAMDFYPLRMELATLITIKKLFRYPDEKFREIGKFGVKFSLLIKLFMKYFISLEKLTKEADNLWEKGGDLGHLKIVMRDKEKNIIVLRVEDFSAHPLYCQIFSGYFSKAIQMIVGKEATCEETKCVFRGDNCHEFLLKW